MGHSSSTLLWHSGPAKDDTSLQQLTQTTIFSSMLLMVSTREPNLSTKACLETIDDRKCTMIIVMPSDSTLNNPEIIMSKENYIEAAI